MMDNIQKIHPSVLKSKFPALLNDYFPHAERSWAVANDNIVPTQHEIKNSHGSHKVCLQQACQFHEYPVHSKVNLLSVSLIS